MNKVKCICIFLLVSSLFIHTTQAADQEDNSSFDQRECTGDELIESKSKGAQKIVLKVKEKYNLSLNTNDNLNDKEIIWVSENLDIAAVDEEGEVEALKPGTVKIEAWIEGKIISEYELEVIKPIEKLTIEDNNIEMSFGESIILKAKVIPEDTTMSKKLVWKSSDETIVSINEEGKILAKKQGKAKVTAISENGKSVSCVIDVLNPITSIAFNRHDDTLIVGKNLKLDVAFSHKDSMDTKQVIWNSSDNSVATVNSNGLITAKKVGKTVITAMLKENPSVNTSTELIVISSNGWNKKANGEWEYYRNGNLVNGWQAIDGLQYYFLNKEMIHDWFLDEKTNTWYFFNGGVMQRSNLMINGEEFVFDNDGIWRGYKPQWIYINDNYYYTDHWKNYVTGWQAIDGLQYKFNNDGTMIRDWHLDEKTNTWYFFNGGVMQRSNLMINGEEYIFDIDGIWRGYESKWVYKNGNYYYTDHWKNYVTGWQSINGLQYKFNNDGTMIRDWYLDEKTNTWYFFNGGAMQKTNLVINGIENIFEYNGIWRGYKPRWVKIDGKYYYRDQQDKNVTGWLDLGKDRYYLRSVNGEMVTGSQTIDRRNYYFNPSSGKLMRMTAPVPYYMQTDSRWKDKKYGGNTMKSSGCAQTCAAMIFSFLKNETILPTDVANWGHKNNYFNGIMDGERFGGTIGSFWPAVAKHYGFTARGNLTVDQAINDLRHGKLMIAGMNPPNFTFYGTTHAIVIYGIDENNYVSVYDPYFKEHNKKYPISQIFKEKSTDPDDKMSGGPIFTIG